MAACFPGGISFSGYTIPIVPGGYSVVGMAIMLCSQEKQTKNKLAT